MTKRYFIKKRSFIAVGLILFSIGSILIYSNSPKQDHFVETPPASTTSTKTEFTINEMLADYDKLWEILEENYYYFPYLENQGIDIESLKISTREQLENRITDINGFYYLLDLMFRKMQNLAHLSVATPDVVSVYQAYYHSDGVPDNGWKKFLENPQTITLYEYLEKVLSPEISEGSAAQMLPGSEAEYDPHRKTVTFRIHTFHDTIYKEEKGFINEYLISLGDAEIDHIIFDICGNGGGNDAYWMENIVAPFGGSYEWVTWCYLRDTELMRSYFFEDYTPKPISGLTGHVLPTYTKELGLTHYIKKQQKLSAQTALGKNITDAKRWVIIDGRVYSSADSFSAFCKATGWATLAGQATHGCGTGTSPVLVSLPNTGLLVRFDGTVAETYEGTLNVITGTKPDIPIKPGIGNYQYVIDQLIDGKSESI